MRPLSESSTGLSLWQNPARQGPFHLSAFLADAAERTPTTTLTVDGMEFTCEQAWMSVLRIATWLQQNGVSRGDKVVTVLRHSSDLHLITLAVAHIGAVVSVISPQIRQEAFKSILEEAEPVCLFLEKTSHHLKAMAENILTVWMTEGLNGGEWDEAEFSEVMNTRPAWGMRFPGKSEDPAFLVFPSSGVAQSHGILLSHEKVRHMLAAQSGREEGIFSLFVDSPASSPNLAVLEA
ncbi:AMP-binding protein [Prosthecobacter dejongeii]|uniref:Acyl-coenzyme A synthetase/AMP-(Fatty) acid ligase n=1 Tax=Prosthecobacter dejongeii TaxID=48465 RepID=A0A7W8DRJ6_9BACT|nr:AMP-binding protein [Prosthecobacter dejongeii]MBB5039558.1 acyl-coenzyme A synthetase/AMP-(fatty) acid ligase [Prosthecobacter dejongeii]